MYKNSRRIEKNKNHSYWWGRGSIEVGGRLFTVFLQIDSYILRIHIFNVFHHAYFNNEYYLFKLKYRNMNAGDLCGHNNFLYNLQVYRTVCIVKFPCQKLYTHMCACVQILCVLCMCVCMWELHTACVCVYAHTWKYVLPLWKIPEETSVKWTRRHAGIVFPG